MSSSTSSNPKRTPGSAASRNGGGLPRSGNGSRSALVQSPNATKSLDDIKADQDISGPFNEFLNSLGNILADLTALEVSTMVVNEIQGDKFSPIRTYRDLYYLQQRLDEPDRVIPDLPPQSQTPIPAALHADYHDLHLQLLENYHYYFPDDRDKPLPHPTHELDKVRILVRDTLFLRTLRKLSEQKLSLDGGDVANVTTDLIYAQTVMQLDGDVINRYHKDLLEDSKLRDFVIEIHQQAVESGQRQWRELIGFMVKLLQSFRPKPKK